MCRSAHPLLRMKRIFKTFIVALCLTAVACTDYQVDIDELNDRVDGLEKTQIANISQQIAAINKSLPQLENTDSELKTMISSMKKTIQEYNDVVIENETKLAELKTEIEAGIADLKSKIEASQSADKQEMLDALTAAKAEIEAQLAALQAEANSKFEQMNSSLEALQAKDDSIEARIADLKTFVNTELVSQKSWAEKTFATLEKQNEILGDIEDIKGDITNLQTSLTQLEERITNEYTEAINSAVATLEDKIAATANDITNAYKDAITKAKGEIKSAYEAKIASSIDELEKSLTRWVNEQLKGYYTIAETDNAIKILKDYTDGELKTQLAYITALQNVIGDTEGFEENKTTLVGLINANKSAIESNDADILKLQQDLAQAIKDLTDGYNKAIAEGIKQDGTIDNRIDELIKAYDTNLQTTITGINTNISSLQNSIAEHTTLIKGLRSDLNAVSDKLDAFISGRVQSLTYIPTTIEGDHWAGVVDGDACGDLTLLFRVSPASMIDNITLEQVSAKIYIPSYSPVYYPVKVKAIEPAYKEFSEPDSNAGKEAKEEYEFLKESYKDVLAVIIDTDYLFFRDYVLRTAVSVSVKDLENNYYDVASEFVNVNFEHYFMEYTATENSSYRDIFNPNKFDLYKNDTKINDDIRLIDHLDHNFVEVQDGTTKLDVQFAQGTKENGQNNKDIKTLKFGPYLNHSDGHVGYDWTRVQLKTGENAFSNCTALTSVDFGKGLSDTSEGANFKNSHLSGLNTEKVTSFEKMFWNCEALEDVKMAYCNTSEVTTMESMFNNCDALKSIDLSGWNTESLTTVQNMFIACDNLETVDLSGWDVRKITNFQGMFTNAKMLKAVNLKGWNLPTGTVTGYAMFQNTKITKMEIEIPTQSTLSVRNASLMFYNTQLDSATITGKITITEEAISMFADCKNLKKLDLTGWTFSENVKLSSMFSGCTSLKTLILDGWKFGNNVTVTEMFKNCPKGMTIYVRNVDENTRHKLESAIYDAKLDVNWRTQTDTKNN